MSTGCFMWADREEPRGIQANKTKDYFICVNKILAELSFLETSKAFLAYHCR